MRESKVQTGLRIPLGRYDELCKIAERSGVSVNQAALMLIDIGLQVVNLGTEQLLHTSARTTQDTDE